MTISICDLKMTQELGREAMAATRGGRTMDGPACGPHKPSWPGRRNSMGDINRSVVINDHSSLDNTGGVIVTGDGNEVFSLGADNQLGDKVHFNIHF